MWAKNVYLISSDVSEFKIQCISPKWLLARPAERIIMTPNNLRSNAWKHFGFDATGGKITQGKTVNRVFKMKKCRISF